MAGDPKKPLVSVRRDNATTCERFGPTRYTLTPATCTTIRINRVANPPHPAPEVEDAPRDAQPARLSGEVL